METCPFEKLLEPYLKDQVERGNGVYSPSKWPELEAHIEGCSTCCVRLDLLTGKSTAAEAAATSERDFLQQLAATPQEALEPQQANIQAPKIDGYDILGELGRGGMGVVYKATQTKLNRTVALKMILAGAHAGEATLERFRLEAEAVARLQHPGIVQIHEVGEHQGLPYFSLEFLEGGSLEAKLKARPLPPKPAARMTTLLAQAIHAAHEKGILHRDLKPANVFLMPAKENDGVPIEDRMGKMEHFLPKIGDFGLAKKLDEEHGQSQSGAVMGTPSYMAPEQAEGKNRHLTPAVDVYALGAILYELLTGRPPFRAATTLETIVQVLADEPVPPSRLNAATPRDLETICWKCLRKEAGKRYGTAENLAEDLARFLRGEPIRARPVGWLERTVLWVHRKPAAAALIASVTLLVVAAVAGLLRYQSEQHRRQVEVAHKRDLAEQATQSALEEAHKPIKELHASLADPVRVNERISDIEGWKAKLDQARASCQRASDLAAGSRDLIDPELLKRVMVADENLQANEAGYKMAKKLDDIRLEASTLIDGKFDTTKAGPKYQDFFGSLGLDFKPVEAAALAVRIRDHRLRYVLVAALDHWGEVAREKKLLAVILEAARLADPDPWRDQVRQPNNGQDQESLVKLARDVDFARQSPHVLCLLAHKFGKRAEGKAQLLRRALVVHPRDFLLNFDLATATKDVGEQLGCYRAALALRPSSAPAFNNLGNALHDKKDLDGAIRHYQKSIELDPTYAMPHYNLGNALFRDKKDVDGAIRHYEKAAELDRNFAAAHYNLGVALRAKNNLDGAIRHYQKAIALEPNDARAHNNLGNVLREKKDLEGAICHFQKAIELEPNFALAYHNLGLALHDKKDLDGAVRYYLKAIERDPNDAESHCNLGHDYVAQGEFKKALQYLKRGHELGTKQRGWTYPSALWVKQCEQFLALDQKILEGKVEAGNYVEQLELAELCRNNKHHYATAVSFYSGASTANPKLADDLLKLWLQAPGLVKPAAAWRYHAATCAARAAAGQGKDAAKLDEHAKAKLRRQALDWLQADLDLYAKQIKAGKAAEVTHAAQRLSHWQRVPDLAGVRDVKDLGKLPNEERKNWQKLWSDVQQLHKDANQKRPAVKHVE